MSDTEAPKENQEEAPKQTEVPPVPPLPETGLELKTTSLFQIYGPVKKQGEKALLLTQIYLTENGELDIEIAQGLPVTQLMLTILQSFVKNWHDLLRSKGPKGSALANLASKALFTQPNPEKEKGGTHYKGQPMEPWDFIWLTDLPFMEGCVVKYAARHKGKGGVEDLDKAIHYLEKIKELEYGILPKQ